MNISPKHMLSFAQLSLTHIYTHIDADSYTCQMNKILSYEEPRAAVAVAMLLLVSLLPGRNGE